MHDPPGNAPIKLPGICFLHVFPLGAEDEELVLQFQFCNSNPPSDGFVPKPHTFYTASIPGMDEPSSPDCSTSSSNSSTGYPASTNPMECDPTTDHKLPACKELVSVPARQSHEKALFAEHKHPPYTTPPITHPTSPIAAHSLSHLRKTVPFNLTFQSLNL